MLSPHGARGQSLVSPKSSHNRELPWEWGATLGEVTLFS